MFVLLKASIFETPKHIEIVLESTPRLDLDRVHYSVEIHGLPLSWPRLSGVPGLASLTITNTQRRTKKRNVSRNAVERSGHMVASDAGIAWLVREAMDGRGRIKLRKLSRSRMSRAAVSATKLKQCVRKQPAKIRKCMCLPSNYALVEFPLVWSELRSVRSPSSSLTLSYYTLSWIGCFNRVMRKLEWIGFVEDDRSI